MLVINLRVLGLAGKRQSLTQVSELYGPWMWTGLAVLLVTGILMLTGDAPLFCTNGVFGVNLLVTALAAITGVVVKNSMPSLGPPGGRSRWSASFSRQRVSLLLWIGTILTAVEVPSRSNVPLRRRFAAGVPER